jgi:4-diphosphocytidyl-2-C-methyl-D-erythritol kinase
MTPPLQTRALAKVNLTLRIVRQRGDGYHEIVSLVAFADIGDELTLNLGPRLELDVRGPNAAALTESSDNLVLIAARHLSTHIDNMKLGRFELRKILPVGAGLGGGSSDAAAALRLLAQLNNLHLHDPRIHEAAAETGSDIPVCLTPTARMFRGRGDHVGPRIELPALAAVLVNPGVHISTPEVFRALKLEPGSAGPSQGPGVDRFEGDLAALIDLFSRDANDLEPPARALSPVVTQALDALQAAPEARFVRMSGSGSTVFGLFDSCRHAARAAKALKAAHPDWWVKPTVLR